MKCSPSLEMFKAVKLLCRPRTSCRISSALKTSQYDSWNNKPTLFKFEKDFKITSAKKEQHTYIVGCQGASQLGGSPSGIPLRV